MHKLSYIFNSVKEGIKELDEKSEVIQKVAQKEVFIIYKQREEENEIIQRQSSLVLEKQNEKHKIKGQK